MFICFLFQLIRDEIRSGKTDKEIFKKLEEDYGETVLYAPKFDMQTAVLWLSPVFHWTLSLYFFLTVFFFFFN